MLWAQQLTNQVKSTSLYYFIYFNRFENMNIVQILSRDIDHPKTVKLCYNAAAYNAIPLIILTPYRDRIFGRWQFAAGQIADRYFADDEMSVGRLADESTRRQVNSSTSFAYHTVTSNLLFHHFPTLRIAAGQQLPFSSICDNISRLLRSYSSFSASNNFMGGGRVSINVY